MKYVLILSSILFLISLNEIESFADEENEILDLDHVLISLDETLNSDPNNITALQNKGSILLKMGNYSEAISNFDTILKINENNTEALNNKGIALYKQELYTKSLLSFYKSLLADPTNEVTFNNTQNVVNQLFFLDATQTGYAIIYLVDKDKNILTYSRVGDIFIQPPLGYVYLDDAGVTKEVDVDGKTIKILQYTGGETFDKTQYVGRADIYGKIGDFSIKVVELIMNGVIVNPGDTIIWQIVIFNPPYLDS